MSSPLPKPRTLYVVHREPMPVGAAVLAVAIHIVFAAVLFVNMSWHHKIPPQASIKLWESMPTTTTTVRHTRKTRPAKPNSAKPARPEFKPIVKQAMKVVAQLEPAPVNAAMPTPVMPPVESARPFAPQVPQPRADLAAPRNERIDKPVLERPEPTRNSPPAPRIETAPPLAPQNSLARADITAPKHKRIDMPARERPGPTLTAPAIVRPSTAGTDKPHPAAAQIAPPPAEFVKPERKTIDRQTHTDTTFAEQPQKDLSKTIKVQSVPKPQVDVDSLRRERALALAENLREEEDVRLDQSLERERAAQTAEVQRRTEEQERKLANELKKISEAARKRRAELEARQAQDAAARNVSDDYRARISAKIRQRVVLPPDLRGNPEAIYEVSLLPGGEVTSIQLLQSSGVPTYDAAVERAVLAAQPLPVPENSGLFHANFKNFLLNFRPQE